MDKQYTIKPVKCFLKKVNKIDNSPSKIDQGETRKYKL